MLVLRTEHYRSGCVRRTLEVYEDFGLAETAALDRMETIRSIEEIDLHKITNLKADVEGITLVRAQSERSMFDATEND